jgi:hypothetical protein
LLYLQNISIPQSGCQQVLTNRLLVSSNELSNSIVVFSLSSLNNLSKYSLHLFLISSSFTKNLLASSLIHLSWLKSCLPFSKFSHLVDIIFALSYLFSDTTPRMPDPLLRSQFSLRFFWLLCISVYFHHFCCDVNVCSSHSSH